MKRYLVLIAVLALALTGVLATTASADVPVGSNVYYMPEPGQPWWVRTDDKVVAITIDDRLKPAYTYSILATLAEHNAPATFFVIGQSIEDYAGTARAIITAGSRIGNHTWSHQNGNTYTGALWQIRRMEQACRYAGVRNPTPLFRSYGGATNYYITKALKTEGYVNVLWDVSAGDTSSSITVAKAVNNVLSHVKPGSIILMHGSVWTTPQALPLILDGLEARGYKVVDLYSYLFPSKCAPPATTTTTTIAPAVTITTTLP